MSFFKSLFSKKKTTVIDGYNGDIVNGKPHGYGTMLFRNGNKYTGEWYEGNMHGKGTYYYKDGIVYEGSFQNGKRSGRGTLTYPTGDYYEGMWADDYRNGEGKMVFSDGRTMRGTFKDDKFIKGIISEFVDGMLKETRFTNEEVISGTATVTLISYPADKKLPVIKLIKDNTGMGLAECKSASENLPSVIKENITANEAEKLKDLFASEGALLEIRDKALPIVTSDIETATILLISFPVDKKIAVIKAVRDFTRLGLAEAVDLIEKLPCILMEAATTADIANAEKLFSPLGAEIQAK